jgi:multicomponent K+:H+ antiporter subunit D
VLVWGGLATVAFGSVGMLASQDLGKLASYSIVTSSGTVIAALGFDEPGLSGGALFYLVSSTLAGCALFLLVELLERAREVPHGPPQLDDGRDRLAPFLDAEPPADINLDDNEEALIGRAIPAALAFLGVAFAVCALVISGLPPLSGFVGKLALLVALLELGTPAAWTLFGLQIVSGLLAATALVRAGIRHFWTPNDRAIPRLRLAETLPIGLLLAASVLLVLHGERALSYTRQTAEALHEPARYIDAVTGARPAGPPEGVTP